MTNIVETKNLRKQYADGPLAVKDISFTIKQGEIFSLLGPNGAGKSTTISMLSCLIDPTSGTASIDGHDVARNPKAVKQAIGVVPQEIALYDTISARENLDFWGKMYGLSGTHLKERIEVVLDIVGLTGRADDKIESFSGGMKRRINIAVGLLHNPKVLFMDEPTVGIDPQSRRRILDSVKELNKQGLTVLYTTHYMEEAEELSDRIGIIDHGELIALGTQDELTATIGEYDTIQLETDTDDPAGLAQSLATLPNIHRVSSEENQLVLQTKQANQVLPSVIQHLAQHNSHIRQLEVQEPNLEAVFLHLTGRALRD